MVKLKISNIIQDITKRMIKNGCANYWVDGEGTCYPIENDGVSETKDDIAAIIKIGYECEIIVKSPTINVRMIINKICMELNKFMEV